MSDKPQHQPIKGRQPETNMLLCFASTLFTSNCALFNEIISLNRAQLEVNKVEAGHNNIFVAGWRPFIGWICGLSIAYHFILEPVIQYILIVNGIQFETPEFDFSQLSTIVMAMLGMSTLRTYEKTKK